MARRENFRRPLVVKFHFPFRGAEAQPRHRVGDHAQSRHSMQVLAPGFGLIAVHVLEKIEMMLAAQFLLDFVGEGGGFLHRPLRQQAGMHQRIVVLGIKQPLVAQPVEQFVAVWRRQHLIDGVLAMRFDEAVGDRQQVQVVVAEHDHRLVAQRPCPAQHRQRIRPAVDQIAHQPQPVARGVEVDFLQ